MNQENAPSLPNIHVLIAAAGSGTRYNDGSNEPPKQYQNLVKKSVIAHNMHTFSQIPAITSIRCIINPEHADWYHDATQEFTLPDPIHGGKERNISIYNALKSISKVNNEDIILIHDAARPLISTQDIQALIDALQTHQAATLATPLSGTIRKAKNGNCDAIIDRTDTYELQTPQGFRYGDILKAHENAPAGIAHTDDTSIVSALGIDVKIVESEYPNFKITHKRDFHMAEEILSSKHHDIRTGTGFDVHAFDTTTGPVRLGGIDIPHPHKLKGHSDADVALHAITDALLGAISAGDIGQHFPPSDNSYKDMNSAIFLEKACELLNQQNGIINNIDLTIICEAPKIAPHIDAIKTRIADITATDIKRINVKATTTEQLGFTGRGEGIAAQASATVRLQT